MRLIVEDGTQRREFAPGDSPVGVGRSPALQIQVAHPLVSRQHGSFRWEKDRWVYEDSSRHGTLCRAPQTAERLVRQATVQLPQRCSLYLAGEGGYRLSCSVVEEPHGHSPRDLYRVAVQAQAAGDHAAAARDFLQLARREPPLADAMRRAAECLGAQGKLPEALVWASRYAMQRPGDPGGWKLLARLHGQAGSVDEARRCLQEARALDAGDPELAALDKRLASYGEAAQVLELATVEVLGRGVRQTLETEHFRIDYDFAQHGRLLPDLAKGLEAAVARSADLLATPREPIAVELTDRGPGSGVAAALGERSAAAACDAGGIRIFLPPHGARASHDAPFLVSLALHEVVHAVLLQRSPHAPWWVHEGLAQFLSLGDQLGECLPPPAAVPELQQLETMPPPAEIEAGYGMAYFAVLALHERLGRTGLATFLQALGGEASTAAALQRCGSDYGQLAQWAWQRWCREQPSAPPHLVTLGEIPGRSS